MWPGVIEAYRAWLPFGADTPVVTLNEGNTPLILAPRLAEEIAPGAGLKLYLKYEGLNPTGSFKDRGMTAAITQAVIEEAETVICASTGNTAASAAAYAARAGLRCLVLVPQGKIALGKLAASLAYGAEVISIDGSFDDGLRMVREITERRPIALVNSVNPWRLEGQKTGAFEIIDQLGGRAPDWHCLPVGNAGNISAYWMGYKQYGRGLPRLLGGQASGSAPIVLGLVVEQPETIATAIRIGNPARWRKAVDALLESVFLIIAVLILLIDRSWLTPRVWQTRIAMYDSTQTQAIRDEARARFDGFHKTSERLVATTALSLAVALVLTPLALRRNASEDSANE